MGIATRKAAEQRIDRISKFRAELSDLAQEGGLILTPEQQSSLDAHLKALLSRLQAQYRVEASDSTKRISWGMRVASLLGAAAFIAAAVLFLHRVWGSLSVPVQVVVITGAPIGLLFAAEVIYRRAVDLYYVSLLVQAAGVALVMDISVLGTILNLSDSPHVLLVWGLFGLFTAYAYWLRLLLGAGLLLLCAWTAAFVLHVRGYQWVNFMQASQWAIPVAVLLYTVPWVTRSRGPEGFAAVFRLCGAGFTFISLLTLSTAGDLCCGGIAPGTVAALYQVAGILLSAAAVAHGLKLGNSSLVNLSAVAFIVFLFVRLHSWWWDAMPKYLFFLLLGVIAFMLLLVFRRIRNRLSQEALT